MTTRNDAEPALELLDDHRPTTDDFLEHALEGLSGSRKAISSKYLYDDRGSRLFDRICELPEYYPTRTEAAILRQSAGQIAAAIGPRAMLIEPGAGSGLKTRILLEAMVKPAAYVPMDISPEHLLRSAAAINADFPSLEVLPVCADFTAEYEIPPPGGECRRRIVFFPGSTLGNLSPTERVTWLKRMGRLAQPHPGGVPGGVLLGVDRVKDPKVIEAAYNDARGVTAAFNLNLLRRMNRELGADFDESAFEHLAVWNADERRIESYIVSRRDQSVTIDGRQFEFGKGERIHTEWSHKFTPEAIADEAGKAGLRIADMWSDPREYFSLFLLIPIT